MSPRIRPWLFEAAVLSGCLMVLAAALFAVVRTSNGSWTPSSGAGVNDGTAGPSVRSSIDDRTGPTSGGLRASGEPPMRIMIRSPQAAPDVTNDATGPLFVETNMAPGATSTRCVAITNAGMQSADVRLFSTLVDGGLAPSVAFRIEAGTGGEYGDCSGFKGVEIFRGTLAELATHHDYESGLAGVQTVQPNRSVTFRLTQRLGSSPTQGAKAEVRFGWEARTPEAPTTFGTRGPILPGSVDAIARRPHAVGRSVADAVFGAAKSVAKTGWPWAVLLSLVIAFFVVQDRIDRRDPRLAGGLVHPEPDVPFGRHLTRSTRTTEAAQ